jgi:hypothetical protein
MNFSLHVAANLTLLFTLERLSPFALNTQAFGFGRGSRFGGPFPLSVSVVDVPSLSLRAGVGSVDSFVEANNAAASAFRFDLAAVQDTAVFGSLNSEPALLDHGLTPLSFIASTIRSDRGLIAPSALAQG